MSNFSLSLSRSPTQDSKILEIFETNKHLLESKTTPLKSDEEYVFEIVEDKDLDNAGDFRSSDCIELLKQSDIVVTNPPFSLFREYVAQLVEYNKKFVIIGNKNAITYKEIFKLIKENRIWLGSSIANNFLKLIEANGIRKIITTKEVNGLTRWFTNLDIKQRHENLETIYTYAKYPEKYPKYDNYDAINVDKTNEIPMDYEGVMGVPITFLDKHNPKQFEIVGQMVTTKIDEFNFGYPYINNKKIYARILIQKRKDSK